ncbi:MAG: glutamyl-tRNA(Gln) amidotransferase subunit A-like [Comamonadaceae bacterium]|nr:MAG: glutamyl-tRNA(Gln) amidotransferase subunit A-like [Comamonadaceae bacterium]
MHGVPTGLQIIGPTYEEDSVMRIGAALERAINWPAWRPSIPQHAPATTPLETENL